MPKNNVPNLIAQAKMDRNNRGVYMVINHCGEKLQLPREDASCITFYLKNEKIGEYFADVQFKKSNSSMTVLHADLGVWPLFNSTIPMQVTIESAIGGGKTGVHATLTVLCE